MKKLSLFAAAAMMLTVACQKQELAPAVDGDTMVTFTVSTGEVATKAIADGTNIDVLHWEIYGDLNENALGEGTVKDNDGDKKFTVELSLVADQEYNIIFWAQVDGQDHYVVDDLRNVGIKTYDDEFANDESRAAFFAVHNFTTENGQSINETVYLRRPFSQLNLGATTLETSLNLVNNGQIEVNTTQVVVTNIATSFNTVTGEGEGEQAVTFKHAVTPVDYTQKLLTVNEENYHWLGMNYLIVNGDADNVVVDIEVETSVGKVAHSVLNVPVKENYRTNILGNFLTTSATFEVVIDEAFDGEYYGPEFVQKPVFDETEQAWIITNALELLWVADEVNNKSNTFAGETLHLAADIDLADYVWTPIGATGTFSGTFEGVQLSKSGEGYPTISNMTVATEGKASAGLFANCRGYISNINLTNVKITGQYKTGAVVGDGLCAKIENCHVDGLEVLVTPYNENEANNVGGIVGYLSAEPTAYVKGCSVKNANITAYRKVGGIVGAANGKSEVSGNSVESSVVTADQTSEYSEIKPADAGAVVGWAHANAVVENNEVAGGINTANANAVKVVVKINDADDINANQSTAMVLPAGVYDFDKTVKSVSLQVYDGNDVVINANDNTVEVGAANSYGFVAAGEGTTLEINDADIDSKGGAIGADNGAKVTINNSNVAVNSASTSGRYNVYAVGQGTEVTINGGTFSFSSTLNQKRAYIYCGEGATVYVNGGTFGKASTRSGYTAGILGDGDVIITGGTFGFDPSNWLAEGVVATKNGAEWTVAPETLVTGTDELKAAVASAQAGDIIFLAEGEYDVAYKAGVKLVGVSADKVTLGVSKGYGVNGDVAIENVTLKFTNANYTGFQHTAVESYKDCVIEGQPFLYGTDVTFDNCTFNQASANAYNVWTYGASDVTFNGCTFNSAGKSVLVYKEAAHVHNVTFNDCVFNASAPVDGKAAVEIDSSFPNGGTGHYTVNLNNSTANGFAEGSVSGNALWNNKKGTAATVNVDGVQVL